MSNNKLRNVDTVRKLMEGNHRTQTRTTVGFSDTSHAAEKNKTRAVGETWVEVNPTTGGKTYWVQRDGFRVKQTMNPEISDAIREVKATLDSFRNCPKDVCDADNSHYLNKKMRLYHGMCMKCVSEVETEMRRQGKWEEYQAEKVKRNKLDFLKDAEKEVQVIKDAMMAQQDITEAGEVKKWEREDIGEIHKKIDAEFEKFRNWVLQDEKSEEHGQTNAPKTE